MRAIAEELDKTLRSLDRASAAALERAFRNILEFARLRSAGAAPSSLDANGYPTGHFERLTGSWADVDFELPDDPPPDSD